MRQKRLQSEIVPVSDLSEGTARQLFEIYARHYDRVDWARFERDLYEKDFVILLREIQSGRWRGFSTQNIMHLKVQDIPVRAVFSGDTVIDRGYWGEQELVRSWCCFVGQVRAKEPETRLFWFLISKGYRTYLYLPLFFREFYPRYNASTPPFEQQLIHTLGKTKYPGHYKPESGLIVFAESQGQLTPELAQIPEGRQDDPHVQFFLARNPRHAEGSELVCLAEIAAANMKSLAARSVAEGEQKGSLRKSAGSFCV
jgi:hypothetical protein